MEAFAQQKCSRCGAALTVPNDTPQSLCIACQRASEDVVSPPSGVVDEKIGTAVVGVMISEKTMIVATNCDTEDAGFHAMTVDFLPSGQSLESAAVTLADATPTKKKRIGRFEVVQVLGRGTFGTVYRAYDPLLDREVALKVPRFDRDDPSMKERFHREAKAAARLHHPNIVTLYENGESEVGPYLVVEFVDGVPLSRILYHEPMELRTAVDCIRKIAEALHYAHTEGIVHRDVKPANIMMNQSGRPQVMDFGLAKRDGDVESRMTVEGQIVGTPNYMSPEQARGAIAEVGAHSDQYSVGVVLYEMLCGRPPFMGEPWSILSRVANEHDNPPPPRSVRPAVPRDLEACCLKALEKNPTARYPSLQAMAEDLDRWLKGLPLIARPIGPTEQLLRWCRKNRLVAGLYAVVATMFLAALIAGWWSSGQFQQFADRAQREADDAKQARGLEQVARLNAERVIVDAFTEAGLTADRNGDPNEAILWFANAVAASANHPSREKHNRIRVNSWLSQIAVPVQAFEQADAWNKCLSYNASGNWLLSLPLNGVCEVLKLSDGSRIKVPATDVVTAATWSPDGKQLAIAMREQVVVRQFPEQADFDRWSHSDVVNCLQFSFDGNLLLVGGDQTVRVRDLSKKAFHCAPVEVGSRVSSASFTPDGQRFAVRCEDRQLRVFSSLLDDATLEPSLELPSDSEGILPPMFIGNDRIVVVDSHRSIRCWNVDNKKMIWEQKARRIPTCEISPDRKWLALGEGFDLALLDATSGEPASKPIAHPNLINGISFHPQSSLVLTAGNDSTVRMFEVPSGKPVGPPISHQNAVHRCVWSPDGRAFATIHWGGQLVRVWKPSEPHIGEFAARPSTHSPFIRFHDSGDRWMPSGFDNGRDRLEFEVCDTKTARALGAKISGPGLISDADFLRDSAVVVLVGGGSRDGNPLPLAQQNLDGPGFVRFVNSENGQTAFEDLQTASQPIAVRVSPDGRTVVVLCERGHLMLLDAANGKCRFEDQAFEGKAATHGFVIRDRIRFSPKVEQFAIWGCDSIVEMRKTSDGELLRKFAHPNGFIHDAQFSPEGRSIATCSSDSDNAVRIWDLTDDQSIGRVLHHSGWVFSAQFSRDGRRLLTASSDKQARIWNVATGTSVLATREHHDQVFGVKLLPNEDVFLACTRDGQITAWDAIYGKMIAPVRQLPAMVYQLSCSRDGRQVLASGNLNPIAGIDCSQWISKPDTESTREDVRMLGELVSSQRVHEGGAATSLTLADWLERWTKFRKKHPHHPALRMPECTAGGPN